MTSKPAKVTDFIPDDKNANKGTERGSWMLEESLRKHGAGRSILVDKNNRIIAGNKTTVKAHEIGLDDVILVESDGTKLIVHKRTDLDLDSNEARMLAYRDNRTSETSLTWDAEQIVADLAAGLDLGEIWRDNELELITGSAILALEDYSDLDEQLDELEGLEDASIMITVAARFAEQVTEWLANGEAKTAPGLGKGILKRCGLL